MIIYPAIDIKDKCCVRLIQGDFNAVSVYSQDPMEVALKWQEKGAVFIHMVDLNGAKTGNPINLSVIIEIAERLSIPVQLGGGIRTLNDIEFILSKGVHRVILGTSAVRNKEVVKNALNRYGDRIAIGIDARDGKVAIEGWLQSSDYDAVDFGKLMEDLGAQTIIYTDISRDGMMKGPNLKAMEEMSNTISVRVIASGGVTTLEDIRNLKKTGVSGVIIGKALYTGDISLEEAIRIAES